jgi:hypothetical protein
VTPAAVSSPWAPRTAGSRTVAAGGGFDFGPDAIHGVRHAGTEPAVTIHAYSPALRGMGAYVVNPDGVLRRERIGGEVELGAPRGRW